MQGRKWEGGVELDEGMVAGLSTNRVRVTLPRQDKSVSVEDEWRQWVVDALEVTNTE